MTIHAQTIFIEQHSAFIGGHLEPLLSNIQTTIIEGQPGPLLSNNKTDLVEGHPESPY